MIDPVFVDSGAWYAAAVPWDVNHAMAIAWLQANSQPLMTSDYVIDETLTLLKARGEMTRAISLGLDFFTGGLTTIHFLTPKQIEQAWEIFRRFRDKDWSFTDCTSKVVVEEL